MALIEMNFAEGGGSSITGGTQILEAIASSSVNTFSVSSGIQAGDILFVEVFNVSSSSQVYTKYDTPTVTGGTIEKIGNVYPANNTLAGTYFILFCQSSEITITYPSDVRGKCNISRLV